jgi:hypothetical protein
MVPQKQLSIFLLGIILLQIIDSANTACTPVKLHINVEYFESSIRKDYQHSIIRTSSSSFRSNFDSLSVSASVAGSGGGFSGSASASYSEVTESAMSMSKSRDVTKTSEITYGPGQNHIIRVITNTVTINGRSVKIETRDIVDEILVKDSPSRSDMRKQAENYIKYHYGDIKGGKVRRNTYEASTCVKVFSISSILDISSS